MEKLLVFALLCVVNVQCFRNFEALQMLIPYEKEFQGKFPAHLDASSAAKQSEMQAKVSEDEIDKVVASLGNLLHYLNQIERSVAAKTKRGEEFKRQSLRKSNFDVLAGGGLGKK